MADNEQEQEDLGGVPNWYREIFPAGPSDGFFFKLGYHSASFVDRGPHQLVVSFDNLSDAGYPYFDVEPWAGKFVRENGWSHLGIHSRGPSWYRDARLIEFLEKLRDDGFFARFEKVTLIGTSMGGFAALAFADLAPGATVVALSPQSTLDKAIVPWEVRFQKGQAQDWTLAYSDAAEQIGRTGKVYILYDSFLEADRKHVMRFPQDKVTHLRAFGLGHKTAVVMRRMDQLKSFMSRAITADLTEAEFYRLIRGRKDIFLYRRNMEEHLNTRGRTAMVRQFRSAFRRRRRAAQEQQAAAEPEPVRASKPEATGLKGHFVHASEADEASPPARAAPDKVAPPDQPPRADAAPPTGAVWPRTTANAWMVETRDGAIRYLSDRYRGLVIGFEERGATTLAQTPDLAIGMVSFGAAASVERPLPETFDWHVVDETLSGKIPSFGARAHGAIAQLYHRHAGRAYRTVIALSECRPGITAAEAMPDADRYQRLLARIEAACAALRDWDKALFVDRICLSLLGGAPQTAEREADAHYADLARALSRDVTRITGQSSFPVIVLSQGAGTRTDGRSEVILAEGRLDLDHPRLGIVVATPCYPFDLMDDMPSTPSPEARLLIDELEALAVAEVQNGGRWQCPSLRFASLNARVITAEFSTNGSLTLDEGFHGFALQGCENDARIASVEVDGTIVRVFCDKPPEGAELFLTYAWGATADGAQPLPANRGALRDDWSRPSLAVSGKTLHRFALSGRARVVEDI